MPEPRVTVLTGGVGGTRLVHGLYHLHREGHLRLTVVANTGDDLEHWGLTVSPDVDTVLYTLAGLAPEDRGWGVAGDGSTVFEAVGRLGGPTWFSLGDRDLATHLVRTEALRLGDTPTAITARLATALGVRCEVLPMADRPRRTVLDTANGPLPFQDWLVRQRALPAVRGVRFEGTSTPTVQVLAAVSDADLVVLAPSNPYVSLDPITTLRYLGDRLRTRRVVAVSPIVAGRAVRGPLAEMIRALAGREPSAQAVADHHGDLVRHWFVEQGDAVEGPHTPTRTIMADVEGRIRLAREVTEVGLSLPESRR